MLRLTFEDVLQLLYFERNEFLAACRLLAPNEAVAKTRAVGDRKGCGGGDRFASCKGMKV